MSNVYQENGFANRKEYLKDLADSYGLRLSDIMPLADILGENEDFDGLVTAVEDYADLLEGMGEDGGWD